MLPTVNLHISNNRVPNVGDKLICLQSDEKYVTAGSHYSIYAIDLADHVYPFSILNDNGAEYWIHAYDVSIEFTLGN